MIAPDGCGNDEFVLDEGTGNLVYDNINCDEVDVDVEMKETPLPE
jgi:hypothetical protein